MRRLIHAWKTRLVIHPAGHFHLANSPRIFSEMAEEICVFGKIPYETKADSLVQLA